MGHLQIGLDQFLWVSSIARKNSLFHAILQQMYKPNGYTAKEMRAHVAGYMAANVYFFFPRMEKYLQYGEHKDEKLSYEALPHGCPLRRDMGRYLHVNGYQSYVEHFDFHHITGI